MGRGSTSYAQFSFTERSRIWHTEAAFTLDRYGHVLPGMQEEASVKLEVILFGGRAGRFGNALAESRFY
jgi:hypothetical protein